MSVTVKYHIVLFHGDYDTFVAVAEKYGLGYWASFLAILLSVLSLLVETILK